jgi:hypothetical protein
VEDARGRPEAIEATGLPPETLRQVTQAAMSQDEWLRILEIRTLVEDAEPAGDLPAVAGDYSLTPEGVRFLPRYPFARGQKYRVTWNPGGTAAQTMDFAPVRAGRESTTRAIAIYPTSDVLPVNLLRIYVEFSAPMRRGDAAQHLRLVRDPGGEPVDLAFVAAEEELWNEARTRLTVFFDPGRIKRGVGPNVEVGPPLEVGKRYRLLVDRGWRDAEDAPLRSGIEKVFLVDEPDRAAGAPGQWRITPPFGRRAPLVVEFPNPLDYALALRAIEVRRREGQQPIGGSVRLSDNEKRWTFLPEVDWRDGSYLLRIDPALEDPSGNAMGRPFETETAAEPQGRGPWTVLPFDVELRPVPSTARL